MHHYTLLVETIGWDETRKVIERDHADEDGHISRWRSLPANPRQLIALPERPGTFGEKGGKDYVDSMSPDSGGTSGDVPSDS